MSSVLPADVSAQLGQLLQQLQSSDNIVRSQAEEVLQNQWTSQRPEYLLMGLAEQISSSPDVSVRLVLSGLPVNQRHHADILFPRFAHLQLSSSVA